MMLTWRQAAPTTVRRWSWLSVFRRPWGDEGEPAEMLALRYGFLPARFRHGGEVRQVRRIERIWDARSRGRRPPQRYFTVRCADDQVCTLFHDLRAGTWHLLR